MALTKGGLFFSKVADDKILDHIPLVEVGEISFLIVTCQLIILLSSKDPVPHIVCAIIDGAVMTNKLVVRTVLA